MLLYARQKNTFTETATPVWVKDWLEKRTEKQEKKTTKEDKPVDEAAQAKRQVARQQKVSGGIEELRLWMKDIIRNGILNMPEKGFAWFDAMAKRMVDAQAPGLANMIRGLGEINFYSEGWQPVFLEQLLNIFLLTEGYCNSELVDPSLLQDIKTWIGFTQSQDELKEQSGITDTWLVLAKQVTETDNVTTEKNWLYGINSGQSALILQFTVRAQGSTVTLTPGMYVQAELVFYPSAVPLRAIIKTQTATGAAEHFSFMANWQQVAACETKITSRQPVRTERPYVVEHVKPVYFDNHWWLQDIDANAVQLKNHNKVIWKLLALSGGRALNMAVIGRGNTYEAVGAWVEKEYKIL